MGPRLKGIGNIPLIEDFFFFFKLEYNEAMPQKFPGKITSNVELFTQPNYQSSVS